MRQIKFRGQFVYANTDGSIQWVYGDLRHMDPKIGKHRIITEQGCEFEVLAGSVGQFTGLHDSKGKDIYEGDIIRSYDSQGEAILHIIEYDDSEAQFITRMPGTNKYDFGSGGVGQRWIDEFKKEVIGNVFDNPELLRPKQA